MNQEDNLSVVNPYMIILARDYRGLTQNELASRLQMTQGHLSKIENGLLDVSDRILNDLAKVLQYPPKFFFTNAQIYPPGMAFYRKYKSLTKKVQCKICSMANIYRLHIEKLIPAIDIRHKHIPQCSLEDYESPEQVATALREYWSVPYGPIKNMTRVIEGAGIIIQFYNFNTRAFAGMSMPASDVYYLALINEGMPWDRIRWTLAHELGHIVMHKLPTPNMEEEANRFASEFLMPAAVIRGELTEVSLQKLVDLKPRWKTSMASLLHRAVTLGKITERQYRSLWMRISSAGWKTREPIELDVPAEPPTLMKEIIDFHFTELKYSPEQLATVLTLEEEDFADLYGIQLSRLKLIKGGVNKQSAVS